MADDTLFPVIWSILSQLLAVIWLVGLQVALRKRRHFELLNEFACCFMWVWWSLETTLLHNMISWRAGSLSLFIRLLLFPYISQSGTCNPCFALYYYYTGDRTKRGNMGRLCMSLFIELLAIPVALVFCHYYWMLLGSAVSTYHFEFIDKKIDYFLTTNPVYGMLYELIPSFCTLLLPIFAKDSLLAHLLNSCLTVVLVLMFDSYTGSFMNPMVALASTLFWHSLTIRDYLVHCLVFWVGPLAATWAAVRVELYYKSYQVKHKLRTF